MIYEIEVIKDIGSKTYTNLNFLVFKFLVFYTEPLVGFLKYEFVIKESHFATQLIKIKDGSTAMQAWSVTEEEPQTTTVSLIL